MARIFGTKVDVKKSSQLRATRLRNNYFSFFGPILMAPYKPCQVLYIFSAYWVKKWILGIVMHKSKISTFLEYILFMNVVS